MPGTATLGDSIVDSLVTVVDDLRNSLNLMAGTRQSRVWRCMVQWSGNRRSDGTPSVVLLDEMIPSPSLVTSPTPYGDPRIPRLDEVSLTWSEAELTGGELDDVSEFFYRVSEKWGQRVRTRYFMLDGAPVVDRDNCQWKVILRQRESGPDLAVVAVEEALMAREYGTAKSAVAIGTAASQGTDGNLYTFDGTESLAKASVGVFDAAYAAGATAGYVYVGPLAGLSGLVEGTLYWAKHDGTLVAEAGLTAGKWTFPVGVATSATTINVKLGEPQIAPPSY